MEAMVARFKVDTPFNKTKERESLLSATPFGEKENGSNGRLLAPCDTDSGKKIVSVTNGDSVVGL